MNDPLKATLKAQLKTQWHDVLHAWRRLAPRERALVLLAAGVLLALLLWLLAVRPVWRVWRDVPPQREQLEAQWLEMKTLAGEAAALKAQPNVSAAQSVQALQAASDRLGAQGRLQLAEGRATLHVTNVSAAQLHAWLSEARGGARARTMQAQLQRQHGSGSYSGQLVVDLPSGGG